MVVVVVVVVLVVVVVVAVVAVVVVAVVVAAAAADRARAGAGAGAVAVAGAGACAVSEATAPLCPPKGDSATDAGVSLQSSSPSISYYGKYYQSYIQQEEDRKVAAPELVHKA